MLRPYHLYIEGWGMKENVIPVDGMVITEDTRFAPGVYPLTQGITIGADRVTLEGEGVLLVDQTRTGAAIGATNRSGITVRGISISGFYHGIRFDHCRDAVVENVRIRDTAEIEGIDTFLYLWKPVEEAYSGAILFNAVQGGAIRHCDAQHQMNGILLYHTTQVTVEHNNASFNSGWGVYMSASNENTVQDNRFDF